MKLKAFNLCVFCGILLFILGFHDAEKKSGGFKELKQLFENPPKEFGPAPLWVWNTKVTRKQIDTMMLGFKKNAFGGVMVHPRPGLITEYLSPEWYELFKYTVNKGKELGLNVWIYDENSYPTGFAGGLVPDQMPESYNQGQMLRMTKVDVFPTQTAELFIAIKVVAGKFMDITSNIGQEKGKKGMYYLFYKGFYAKQAGMVGPPDFPYVDLMVKGVTAKFIDLTFKGYEKAAGTDYGKAVPGIFSDEPSIPAHGAGNIRWTPDLFSTFKQTWGYDLESNLPSLFEETGDWRKIRHNYITVLSQLFIDRWSKPMFAYTEQHHLKWTGHYWEHGWPNPNDVPDNMAMYAWHQYPGIDMLFNQFDEESTNAQFGNIRAVKELASVANQLDKKRTLSETYGGGGWELTFKDMKRLGDWEYVLGVNFLNQHLSMMSIDGARKYDYPQSFSYHTPWWQHYKALNQYFSRLSVALASGKQENHILILEPTTSAWMYTSRTSKNLRFGEIGDNFQKFVTTLEKAQVEYDLGSENIIKDHGKVIGTKFVVGKRGYTTVVIPPGMENIDLSTFKLLKTFIANGGKVACFERLKRLDGQSNAEVAQFGTAKANVVNLLRLDQQTIKAHFTSTEFQLLQDNKLTGGNIYHHRRKLIDGQLIFLANASLDSTAIGKAIVKGRDALIMDLFTGEVLDYPDKIQREHITIDYKIPPAGSLLVYVANQKQGGYKKYTIPKEETVVNSGATTIIRPVENTLMIDFCDLKFGDTLFKDAHVLSASRTVFTKNGFNRNPWDHQMQFRKRVLERDTFARGTGFTASYHFNIDKKVDFEKFRAVIEKGKLWTSITINGMVVQPVKDAWWLDKGFSVLEIGKYLKEGINTLSISIDSMSVFAEIEPIYILGNFNLEPAAKGWLIVPAKPLVWGRWDKQGLPLYGQGITYKKTIKIDDVVGAAYFISLGTWKGTVAAVKINGKKAGIIYAEPNTLNIESKLTKGDNLIEVEIIGSLKNLLGPHHNSPKPGMVGPGHWNVKSYPAGEKYDTYGYGMMEDFKIFKYK